jgi:hypothetical protein
MNGQLFSFDHLMVDGEAVAIAVIIAAIIFCFYSVPCTGKECDPQQSSA